MEPTQGPEVPDGSPPKGLARRSISSHGVFAGGAMNSSPAGPARPSKREQVGGFTCHAAYPRYSADTSVQDSTRFTRHQPRQTQSAS